jgi:hypothetical protein
LIFYAIPSHPKLHFLADQLLKQSYITALDNYYNSHELFSSLNQLNNKAAELFGLTENDCKKMK